MRRWIGDEQAKQALDRKGVCFVDIATLEIHLPRFRKPALRDQLYRVGKSARSFQGEKKILLRGGGCRNSSGGEAEPDALSRDLRPGQPGLLENRDFVAPADRGELPQRRQDRGPASGPSARIDSPKQLQVRHRAG